MSAQPEKWPDNAWLTFSEVTARWGKQTNPNQREYVAAARLTALEAVLADKDARVAELEAELRKTDTHCDVWELRASTRARMKAASVVITGEKP